MTGEGQKGLPKIQEFFCDLGILTPLAISAANYSDLLPPVGHPKMVVKSKHPGIPQIP